MQKIGSKSFFWLKILRTLYRGHNLKGEKETAKDQSKRVQDRKGTEDKERQVVCQMEENIIHSTAELIKGIQFKNESVSS